MATSNTTEFTPAYKSLRAYQYAHKLVVDVYARTRVLPKEETFGLLSQMRRAAVSVPANIIEGWARSTSKDKRNFYIIARGSLNELMYYFDLTVELSYLSPDVAMELQNQAVNTLRQLQGLINSQSQIANSK